MLFLLYFFQPKSGEALKLFNVLINPFSVYFELSCIKGGDFLKTSLGTGHSSLEIACINKEVLILLSAQFFIETHHFMEYLLAHMFFFDSHTPDIHYNSVLSQNFLIFRIYFGLQFFLNLENR